MSEQTYSQADLERQNNAYITKIESMFETVKTNGPFSTGPDSWDDFSTWASRDLPRVLNTTNNGVRKDECVQFVNVFLEKLEQQSEARQRYRLSVQRWLRMAIKFANWLDLMYAADEAAQRSRLTVSQSPTPQNRSQIPLQGVTSPQLPVDASVPESTPVQPIPTRQLGAKTGRVSKVKVSIARVQFEMRIT